jgi:hypothetical protein
MSTPGAGATPGLSVGITKRGFADAVGRVAVPA